MESGWTVETLKEHFEAILIEKDRAINIALASAKEASLKTEQAQRDYNQTHNDLLRKMDEQHKATIPRTEFEAAISRVQNDISEVKLWREGTQGSMKIILWLVSIAVTIIAGIAIKIATNK